jgi:EAL domain-containing protein (putative c-di-GMP-specific phosphodiesterase class I)
LLHDLRRVLEQNEFLVYFQPQARIEGEVIGFEALVRWNHPTRGFVPPDQFIPLAEENGLIIQIGEWILREACREAASCHGRYRSPSISHHSSSRAAISNGRSTRSCWKRGLHRHGSGSRSPRAY